MDANTHPVLKLFENKIKFEVPLYQRQYIWKLDQQWTPLWEDIQREFIERIDTDITRHDAPPHFLGAMVLDQRQVPTTHVERRMIIDGQQRLITLQIFLAAYRDFCRFNNLSELASECDRYLTNPGVVDPNNEERFKVWPTQLDRPVFMKVISAGSKSNLENNFPLNLRKYARKPDPRPLMADAYIYFYNQISEFFLGTDGEKPLGNEIELSKRLDTCLLILKQALLVVVIDLDKEDDPQVIFETLNARGEPLLPADLLRNFVFLRASCNKESSDDLYQTYWSKFDDNFWRTELRQGRLLRPSSDLFLQHFLASQLASDIPIKHLYVEYKNWIIKKKPFNTVREELEVLSKQGDFYRDLISIREGFHLHQLAALLSSFDVSTVYPLLLYLNSNNYSKVEWPKTSEILESYIVRRAVCGYTTKNYNQIFLGLIRYLKKQNDDSKIQAIGGLISNYLAGLSGQTGSWPNNELFMNAWVNRQIYDFLETKKIVYILKRLNGALLTPKSEELFIKSPLTVEHILPQKWIEEWPLPDGSEGMTEIEIFGSEEDDPRAIATKARNIKIQTLGNLTLLTQPLNSSVSNSEWNEKKPKLLEASVLPINQQLYSYSKWDESQIQKRGKELFEKAKLIWPEPPKLNRITD